MKGWWDYVELVQRFARKFDVSDVTVIGHYIVRTPPPEEQLPMPAVALVGDGLTVALKWDFGAACRWPREWTVSVRRRSPYLGPTFGLFDPNVDLRGERVEGLSPDYVFGPYRENPAEFTCELDEQKQQSPRVGTRRPCLFLQRELRGGDTRVVYRGFVGVREEDRGVSVSSIAT